MSRLIRNSKGKFSKPSQFKAILFIIFCLFIVVGILNSVIEDSIENRELTGPFPRAMTDLQVYAQEIEPTPTPEPEPEPTTEWEAIMNAGKKVCKIYNFPCNVVLAQAALESARGNSRFCIERKNCLGIGAYDENPDMAYTFENYEQSFVEYMRIIRKNFSECWEKRNDSEALLRCLKSNKHGKQYATDPNYVNKVMSMKEWNQ